ncbi:response regulator transcription factor [Nocardioides renjunii]|uniref:response regulator transcription factor n=1 Tax=Nocardioides renjunii TaxID=3095075 RepID=UPI002AFE379E|nr:response regulator transcription factor [Nocardioides sp. S-34]WQQ22778.1 response regulator transcription factor [Nocardioides sp. S-34]
MERHPAPATRHIKVAVVDESELVVHGIRAMLEPHSALVTVVPHRSEEPSPLCDLTLYEPSAHGRSMGTRAMPQRFPTRMVAYGWDCSPEAVSTEMSRGAAGFVSKWLPARRLIWNLLQIADGRVVVDAWTGQPEASRPAAQKWPLTQRETEVLSMIAAGRANKEIAEETNLSINSVKSYIRGAYSKIEVTSRSQAVLWAIQHGLLMSDGAEAARSAASVRPVAHARS